MRQNIKSSKDPKEFKVDLILNQNVIGGNFLPKEQPKKDNTSKPPRVNSSNSISKKESNVPNDRVKSGKQSSNTKTSDREMQRIENNNNFISKKYSQSGDIKYKQ